MTNVLLKNARCILPGEVAGNVSVLVADGVISGFNPGAGHAGREIDLAGATLWPGFIDIHNHGAVGVDVNLATPDNLHDVSRFLATRGVTAWVPTLVPDSTENYRRVIEAIDNTMILRHDAEPAARILGVHYEGVFANEKMCGALRPEFFRSFTNGDEVLDIPTLSAANAVHLTTMAPEIAGGVALILELKRKGWIVSIGHTRADAATLDEARRAGASHVTHLFNAMTGVHHREIGVAGWALTSDISCEIIADGIHVHPTMLEFAYHNKSAETLALVSDSVAPTGSGDGTYELWGEHISVAAGRTQNERGSIAGSVITMLDAVRQMLSIGIPETEVSKMASLAPALVLGIEKDYGSIEIGKRADLVAIDANGDVVLTLVGGEPVAFLG